MVPPPGVPGRAVVTFVLGGSDGRAIAPLGRFDGVVVGRAIVPPAAGGSGRADVASLLQLGAGRGLGAGAAFGSGCRPLGAGRWPRPEFEGVWYDGRGAGAGACRGLGDGFWNDGRGAGAGACRGLGDGFWNAGRGAGAGACRGLGDGFWNVDRGAGAGAGALRPNAPGDGWPFWPPRWAASGAARATSRAANSRRVGWAMGVVGRRCRRARKKDTERKVGGGGARRRHNPRRRGHLRSGTGVGRAPAPAPRAAGCPGAGTRRRGRSRPRHGTMARCGSSCPSSSAASSPSCRWP